MRLDLPIERQVEPETPQSTSQFGGRYAVLSVTGDVDAERPADFIISRVAANVKSEIEKKSKKRPTTQTRLESPPPERRPLAGNAPLAPLEHKVFGK